MAKILLAESSEKALKIITDYFQEKLHEVFIVKDKENLYEIIDSVKLDAGLIDVNFQGIPAIDILNIILDNKKNSSIQIIVSTEKSNRDVINKFTSSGASFVFMKPYRLSLLEEKMKQISRPRSGTSGAFDPMVIKIFLESTIHIFYTLARMNIEAGKPFLKSGNKAIQAVSAVIGLSSFQIRGAMSISLDKSILKRFLTNILGINARQDDGYLNDICGEIANQVLGRAKQQFLKKKNMSFDITVPTVLSGPEHILDYKLSAPVLVIPFTYEKKQTICVEFSLMLNNESDLFIDNDKVEVAIEEGELILF